jgi:hypothetical protein
VPPIAEYLIIYDVIDAPPLLSGVNHDKVT